MKTADGVEIVVGMLVWWWGLPGLVSSVVAKTGVRNPTAVYSTRSAAIDAEITRLRAEIARVEAMREGGE